MKLICFRDSSEDETSEKYKAAKERELKKKSKKKKKIKKTKSKDDKDEGPQSPIRKRAGTDSDTSRLLDLTSESETDSDTSFAYQYEKNYKSHTVPQRTHHRDVEKQHYPDQVTMQIFNHGISQHTDYLESYNGASASSETNNTFIDMLFLSNKPQKDVVPLLDLNYENIFNYDLRQKSSTVRQRNVTSRSDISTTDLGTNTETLIYDFKSHLEEYRSLHRILRKAESDSSIFSTTDSEMLLKKFLKTLDAHTETDATSTDSETIIYEFKRHLARFKHLHDNVAVHVPKLNEFNSPSNQESSSTDEESSDIVFSRKINNYSSSSEISLLSRSKNKTSSGSETTELVDIKKIPRYQFQDANFSSVTQDVEEKSGMGSVECNLLSESSTFEASKLVYIEHIPRSTLETDLENTPTSDTAKNIRETIKKNSPTSLISSSISDDSTSKYKYLFPKLKYAEINELSSLTASTSLLRRRKASLQSSSTSESTSSHWLTDSSVSIITKNREKIQDYYRKIRQKEHPKIRYQTKNTWWKKMVSKFSTESS